MGKKIVIIGTMDTKGEQLMMLKEKIAAIGHHPVLMDLSMGGKHGYQADIGPNEIASLAGKQMEDIFAEEDRAVITNWMTQGAVAKARALLGENSLDGIVSLGGMSIALIGARIMSQLPFGIPKVIGTTAAMPAYVGKLFGATDITVMQLIMEIAGTNDLIKNAISQVAGAICGMAAASVDHRELKLPKGSIAITQIGFSDRCAKNVENLLEEKGYTVFPFHAQGISDRAMDKLISQGFFDGVIDIVPAGLIEAKTSGNRAADMTRLDAAGERGIPQVWAPCCLNITGAGPTRVNREKYEASGRVFKMDEMRSMARFPKDELEIGARLYAEKLNHAKGLVKLVVPLKGWSSIDKSGSVLYDPEQDGYFIEALKKQLEKPIEIEEIDANLEDFETAKKLVDSLDAMMASGPIKGRSNA
ncbi:Tm-1-like ATP-binding domain-containing protein [Desulfocastanea catecholica]